MSERKLEISFAVLATEDWCAPIILCHIAVKVEDLVPYQSVQKELSDGNRKKEGEGGEPREGEGEGETTQRHRQRETQTRCTKR